MVTSTSSSSPSIELATTLESPAESASEPVVRTISGSMLSATLALASSSSKNSGEVEKVAIFSRTFLLIISSLRAYRYIVRKRRMLNDIRLSYLLWRKNDEMRNRSNLPALGFSVSTRWLCSGLETVENRDHHSLSKWAVPARNVIVL